MNSPAPRAAIETIPEHLRPFIARQDADLYTPIDHASWRFILRISRAFFADNAHPKYLAGLVETGISADRIPLISEMDEKLRRFGWRAVPVSGFIPPAVFMEFQSLGILPIACDMRTLEHLAYTPAPDIVHEAAGHAPIIADVEYATYLRQYGEVSRKAIFSAEDQGVYEAVRDLSDIKENPRSTPVEIEAAEKRLEQAGAAVDYISEANQLARMNWWTVEYGLIGDLKAPKIYGAGLLSSVGESYNCLTAQVEKRPFELACIEQTYDITRPQPHLYVTRDFAELGAVLEQFAKTMAFRLGGVEGMERARRARTATTCELDSGVQASGVLADFDRDVDGTPIYLKFSGPCQLAFKDVELEGHSTQYHAQGFGTPIGPVREGGSTKNPSALTAQDLEAMGFKGSSRGLMEFVSGARVEGILKSRLERDGKTLVLAFENCTVSRGADILFKPEWGTFDMACGISVRSVFGGAADRGRFIQGTGGYRERPRMPLANHAHASDPNRLALVKLYAEIREVREAGKPADTAVKLAHVHEELEKRHAGDWLSRIELLELNQKLNLQAPWAATARKRLDEIAASAPDKKAMITRGLAVIEKEASK